MGPAGLGQRAAGGLGSVAALGTMRQAQSDLVDLAQRFGIGAVCAVSVGRGRNALGVGHVSRPVEFRIIVVGDLGAWIGGRRCE